MQAGNSLFTVTQTHANSNTLDGVAALFAPRSTATNAFVRVLPADTALFQNLLPFPRPTRTDLFIMTGIVHSGAGGKARASAIRYSLPTSLKDSEFGLGAVQEQVYPNATHHLRIAIIAMRPDLPMPPLADNPHILDDFRKTLSLGHTGYRGGYPYHPYDEWAARAGDPRLSDYGEFYRDPPHLRAPGRPSKSDPAAWAHTQRRVSPLARAEVVPLDGRHTRLGAPRSVRLPKRPMLFGRRAAGTLSPVMFAPNADALANPFHHNHAPVDYISPASVHTYTDPRISRETPALFLIDIPLTRPDSMTRILTDDPAHPFNPRPTPWFKLRGLELPERPHEDDLYLCGAGMPPFDNKEVGFMGPDPIGDEWTHIAEGLPLVLPREPVAMLHTVFHAYPGIALLWLTLCAETAERHQTRGGADRPCVDPGRHLKPLWDAYHTLVTCGGVLPAYAAHELWTGVSAPLLRMARPLPLAVTLDTFNAGLAGDTSSMEAALRVQPAEAWQAPGASPFPFVQRMESFARSMLTYAQQERAAHGIKPLGASC